MLLWTLWQLILSHEVDKGNWILLIRRPKWRLIFVNIMKGNFFPHFFFSSFDRKIRVSSTSVYSRVHRSIASSLSIISSYIFFFRNLELFIIFRRVYSICVNYWRKNMHVFCLLAYQLLDVSGCNIFKTMYKFRFFPIFCL